MRLLALATLLAAPILAGCGTATIDEAFGRPDATEWTYFTQSPADVQTSLSQYYRDRGVATEQSRDEAGGVVLTFANQRTGGQTAEILVQATATDGFAARAQLYPGRRPLPRDVEAFVTRGQ